MKGLGEGPAFSLLDHLEPAPGGNDRAVVRSSEGKAHLAAFAGASYLARQGASRAMDQIKFIVLDGEDLEVASAHLQDAVVKVADVHWRPQEKRLVVGLCRFDWEGAAAPKPEYRRRLAALRFERVLSCKSRDVNPAGKDAVLNLLDIEFTLTDAPAGVITLNFSGGATLRLEVECLEAELADLGPSWTTGACPQHAEIEGAATIEPR